ncbi:MAG: pilus assembly PilX N-terminal domain-containing protein [Deltaproteobacteria bacterium]|nr:pilus assembly PilX N-terminal domain-containing protein [Deltaproteobacteria bacterium]
MRLLLSKKLRLSRIGTIYKNENGAALIIGLMFVAILAMLGTSAVIMTTTDIQIGANYKSSVQTLSVAEAGIQEALFRIGLPDSTKTIADWGSQVNINGVTNAYIGDLSSGGYDPDWQVKIHFVEDATTLTSPDTATLLPKDDWPNMNYDGVVIRHEKESDIGVDLNGDGDKNDLVFYSPSAGKNATNSPPGEGKPITWIESIGKNGTAEHKICVEATNQVFAINSKGAVVVNNPPNFSGNSTILGFNFKKETSPDFDGTGNEKTIYQIKDKIGDPGLNIDHYGNNSDDDPTDIETGDDAVDVPYVVDNSGNWMLQDGGHLPGAVSTGDLISPSGSNDVFGGNGTQPWKDEGLSSWEPIQDVLFDPAVYPDAAERLSMLNDLLAKANVTDADLAGEKLTKAPLGIIHVTGNLDLANDTPLPSSGYGEGLMYVEGNLKVSGNIAFKGLIFVKGDADITGTFWNLGVIFVKGTTIDMLGSATTLYSKQILDELEDFTKTVKTISWRNIF